MARTTFLRQPPTRSVPTAPDSPDPAPLPEPDTATAVTLVAARDLRPLGRILLEDGAVDPNDLAKSFGSGVKLKRAAIEMTAEPVTTGIEKRLGWLARSRLAGMLDGRRYHESNELSNSLTANEFQRGTQ